MSEFEKNLTIVDSAYHRNGVGGNPFRIAVVKDDSDLDYKLVIMFDEQYSTAVVSLDKLLHQQTIAFGDNSYRGDMFDDALRGKLFSSVQAELDSPA
jgi:hypothetical protein